MSKMTKLLFILVTLMFSAINFLEAQITFQKTYGDVNGGDVGYSVQQTTDGGYIIGGLTNSMGAGGQDIYLIKTDSLGDTLWTRAIGWATDEWAESIQQTSDGGYIIVGITYPVDTAAEVLLIKTDVAGVPTWIKTYGGIKADEACSVQQTTDGGFIIGGFSSYNMYPFDTTADILLIKTDTVGDTLWTRRIGGTNGEVARRVEQTLDGGYIISGWISYQNPNIETDVLLIKTDTTGIPVWIKAYGGIGMDGAFSVQQTTDGGYILVGFSVVPGGGGGEDVYLIKTDASGDTLWTKSFGDSNIFDDEDGFSVKQTADGGYILAGITYGLGAGNRDSYLIKTDSYGDTLWTRTFGGTWFEEAYSVDQTSDGGYVITGSSSLQGQFADVYLIKTDSLGNSGCSQTSPPTFVSNIATSVSTFSTVINNPAIVITTPAPIVGSGGVVNTICTSVGINEITVENSFFISPNPTAGYFMVTFEKSIKKGNIEIFNTLGQDVFKDNIFNETIKEINLNNSQSGIYFVKVSNGENSYCVKLIIENH